MNKIEKTKVENMSKINVEIKMDKKVLFSTLWIFVTLNYLYCDIMGLMDPELLRQFLTGTVNGMKFTESFLLGAAILMEIPMTMVLLSRLLKYRVNRWANILAGIIMTTVQISSLFAGSGPTHYYIFCSAIEIACTSFIVWYSWRWQDSGLKSILEVK